MTSPKIVARACCNSPWRTWLRRALRFVSWIVPGAVLALMPKCPVCLAAYIALGTGVALSLPAAENLRLGAVVLSGALLAALLIRVAVRFSARTRAH
jgi:hypothetical protein